MNLKIIQTSVYSFTIYISETINPSNLDKISCIHNFIKNLDGIQEIVCSYVSIYVEFDFLNYNFSDYKNNIMKQNFKLNLNNKKDKIIKKIPVFYDFSVGFDLKDIMNEKNLSLDEIIYLHTNKTYKVYANGFLPGFSFLAKIDEKLKMPRLSNPRLKIPKGSVGIADIQTAVYPKQSAGGWRILGQSPHEMFSKKYDGLSFLKVGDEVQFYPISKRKFHECN